MSDNVYSTNSSALLIWQYPGGTVDYYIIQYVLAWDSAGFNSSNATKQTVNGSQTSTVIDSLLPEATYKFRVAVMNNHGMSPFSECGIFQTLGE